MVFQNPEDQIVATIVEEDTAFGPENLAIRPGEIRERVDESLKTVDMFEHRLRAPHLLSAGQMQRVALAGVLSMRPECVIFDETTAMLDPRGRQEVLEEMQQLHANGITVLFITHFMEEAALADRILALNHGKIAFDGKPADLFKDQQTLEQCDLGQPAYLQLLNEMRKMNAVFKHLPDDFELALTSIPPYDGEIPQVENYRTPNKPESVLIKVENLRHTYMLNAPGAAFAHGCHFHGQRGYGARFGRCYWLRQIDHAASFERSLSTAEWISARGSIYTGRPKSGREGLKAFHRVGFSES